MPSAGIAFSIQRVFSAADSHMVPAPLPQQAANSYTQPHGGPHADVHTISELD